MQEKPQEHDEQQRTGAKIVAQVWADEDFKARLLADPAAVLKDAGLDEPADVELRVLENTANLTYLVLPAVPDAAQISEQVDVRVAPGCCSCGEIPKCADVCCDASTSCIAW
jgi:hypothetical protein